MKSNELITYVESRGCALFYKHKKHRIYKNPINGNTANIPYHPDLRIEHIKRICRLLDIPLPPNPN